MKAIRWAVCVIALVVGVLMLLGESASLEAGKCYNAAGQECGGPGKCCRATANTCDVIDCDRPAI